MIPILNFTPCFRKMKRIAPTNEFVYWNQPGRFVIPTGIPIQTGGNSNIDSVQHPNHVTQTSGNVYAHPSGSHIVHPSAPMDCSDR